MLPDVMERFEAEGITTWGSEDLDKIYAERAGFSFLWPNEAVEAEFFQL
ncbi:MAG: hypothetical protein CM1200mP24_05770 [Gammaproteobacteria bacterium]|nr:MAG: hypothetical protein CM1200mP24_05770 [Gammaproteobacteria bacterium]